MKIKLPHSVYNWISVIGATIAVTSFSMIVFLFVIAAFLKEGSSYLGLVIYIVLPVFLIIGLILIPVGMFIKIKRTTKADLQKISNWPVVDLNNQRNRNAFIIFTVGTAIFLLASAVGSYEAFNYTESVQFCGTTCHTVMTPEYTAYQNSPHARVACVDCHVGSGASWYVKSKMSGLYQVYAVTLGHVPKPITTPIKNLRPARETCEQCHWPEKFYAWKLVSEKHFLADKDNTEWDINLTMKIGAAHSALGYQEGIHWHINPNVRIEYKAQDEQRQKIPWVKYTDLKTGKSYVFQDSDVKLDKAALDTMETRVMDCMDCHNRPSHNYQPPAFFINNAMTNNSIPKELPEIKSVAMDILGGTFGTTDSAMMIIDQKVNKYYQDNYPDIYNSKKELVTKAITGIQTEFKKNMFPEMKVKWDVYPNNIGHIEFNGCFRCHNGTHNGPDGKVISRDCNLCHTINSEGTPGNIQYAKDGGSLEFKHPVDIDEAWKESACVECHTGLNP